MFAEEFGGHSTAWMSSETMVETAVEMQSLMGLPLTADRSGNVAAALVNWIESQLSQSLVYRRAVESLQQLLADQTTDGQMLLKAVSLEAIRLTLQAIGTTPGAGTIVNTAPAIVASVTEMGDVAVDHVAVDDDALDNDLFEAIATVTQTAPTATSNPLSQFLDRYKAKRQIAVESVKILTRAEILTQIGAQIQLEREQKNLTIAQLHARTFIPMYHLQALEGGHVEQLPEDVYLRGFLRRIENALGLEVSSLIDKLPNEPIDHSILPSWAGNGVQGVRRGFGGLDINPTHLYVTYAAIMAGGVCWLSNQTAPTAANLPDLTNYEPRAEAPSTAQMQASKLSANRLSHKIGNAKSAQSKPIEVGSVKNIAPPETLR